MEFCVEICVGGLDVRKMLVMWGGEGEVEDVGYVGCDVYVFCELVGVVIVFYIVCDMGVGMVDEVVVVFVFWVECIVGNEVKKMICEEKRLYFC